MALVSGASAGMGRAIARELAAEGAKVALAARGLERLEAVSKEIAFAGGEAIAIATDMVEREGVAHAAFGPIDTALANVGPLNRFGLNGSSDEDFRTYYEQLVISMVHLARELAPSMRERRWGGFLNIGSVCAKELHRFFNLILSNTGRAAALGLNRTLSNEFAADGFTVNTILPGVIDTGTLQHVDSVGGNRVEDLPRIPAGRSGTVEEVAGLSSFLCSKRASYITGQVIAVDGGYTRGLF